VKLLGYLMRHGETSASPSPEGWRQIGLNELGRQSAEAGADFLIDAISAKYPKPDYVISSDLCRASQTGDIVADRLGVSNHHYPGMFDLRAFNPDEETALEYEERCSRGLGMLLSGGGIPLIVAHRSTTAYLDKTTGPNKHDDGWEPDYVHHMLLHEGGIMAVGNPDLVPLHRPVDRNWPPGLCERSRLPHTPEFGRPGVSGYYR